MRARCARPELQARAARTQARHTLSWPQAHALAAGPAAARGRRRAARAAAGAHLRRAARTEGGGRRERPSVSRPKIAEHMYSWQLQPNDSWPPAHLRCTTTATSYTRLAASARAQQPPTCCPACQRSAAGVALSEQQANWYRRQQHRRGVLCGCSIGLGTAACAPQRALRLNACASAAGGPAREAAPRVAPDHHSGAWRCEYRVGCAYHNIIEHRLGASSEQRASAASSTTGAAGFVVVNVLRGPRSARMWACAAACHQMQLQRWRAVAGQRIRRQRD